MQQMVMSTPQTGSTGARLRSRHSCRYCGETGGQVDCSNTPMTQAPPTAQQEAAEELCSENSALQRWI